MKSFLIAAALIVGGLSIAAASEPKKVCDANGCRIVEVPKSVAAGAVKVTEKVSHAPQKVFAKVRSGKPVRSFLRKVFR